MPPGGRAGSQALECLSRPAVRPSHACADTATGRQPRRQPSAVAQRTIATGLPSVLRARWADNSSVRSAASPAQQSIRLAVTLPVHHAAAQCRPLCLVLAAEADLLCPQSHTEGRERGRSTCPATPKLCLSSRCFAPQTVKLPLRRQDAGATLFERLSFSCGRTNLRHRRRGSIRWDRGLACATCTSWSGC